jgi:hypothetical protein
MRAWVGCTALTFLLPTPIAAQQVTVYAAGLHARYADSITGSAGALSARLVVNQPRVYTVLDVGVSRFVDGPWVTQAAGQFFGALGTAGRVTLGLRADGSVNQIEGGTWSGSGTAGPMVAFRAERWLAAITVTGGGVRDVSGTGAGIGMATLRLGQSINRVMWNLQLAGTAAGSLRFADAGVGLEYDGRAIVGGVSGGMRLGDLGDTPWAQARLEWHMLPFAALEATIGTYPADVMGFTEGFYVTAGLRLGRRHVALPAPRGIRIRRDADGRVRAVFELEHQAAVAIAGEWNDWTPAPLDAAGPGRWSATLGLAPGVYRFALVTADGAWVVPPGVPRVADDFGGEVGLLLVR